MLLMAMAVVAPAQEQYPIFTADQLAATMTTLGPNLASVGASLDDGDMESAKARLVRSREQLATTITFWRDHERDDAVGYLRNTVRLMDQLDDTLSSASVDLASAARRLDAIQAACQSCHVVYRERDPATNEYRINAEALSLKP